MTISPLIVEAKRLLTTHPRDNVHDLSHHQRVWENVQVIAESIDQHPNMDVLEVATFWHDVMVRSESLSLGSEGLFAETMDYLERFMSKKRYDKDFQIAVMEAVKHHNFLTQFQQSLEGKILFDAQVDPNQLNEWLADNTYWIRTYVDPQFDGSRERLLQIQATAYRALPCENYPDEFSAGMLHRHAKQLGIHL